MTGAQTVIYTAAIALSTMGCISIIAGWVIPQPMIHGAILAVILDAAVVTWLVLIVWVADTRQTARIAEQKRRALAAEYTQRGRRRA